MDGWILDKVITMENCINNAINNLTITGGLAENYPNDRGGGMLLIASNPTLTHVIISGNTADYSGGGMYLDSSNPTLILSLIHL